MTRDEEKIWKRLTEILDSTSESDCALQIRDLVDCLSKLARLRWRSGKKSKLWNETQIYWDELMDLLSDKQRSKDLASGDESAGRWFDARPESNLRNIVFLAARVASGKSPDRREIDQIEMLWNRAERNRDAAFKTILVLRENCKPVIEKVRGNRFDISGS